MAKGGAKEVTAKDFEEKVIKSKGPVIVDFWGQWCGPCQAMMPSVDKASEKFKEKVKIYKVDIEKSPDLAAKYSVLAVPTLIFFKNGKPVDQAGFLEKDQLSRKIEEFAQ